MPDTVINAATVSQFALQGSLVFDNGLPAVGITTRLYNVGFAGQDALLGETEERR